jgi:hypothetical protein
MLMIVGCTTLDKCGFTRSMWLEEFEGKRFGNNRDFILYGIALYTDPLDLYIDLCHMLEW